MMADTDTPAAPSPSPSPSPSDHAESLDQEVIDGSEHKPLQQEPTENDVVLAESMLVENHPGNEQFLRIVRERLEEYDVKPRLEKPMVAVDILNQWRAQGRRFLKKDEKTGQWQDIGDKKARQKISKALQTQKSTVAETALVGTSRTSRRISTRLDYTREGSKLYGRSKEQEELGRIYSRLKDSSSAMDLVLILGETGTGKTALAHSLESPVKREGGFFVQAKFELHSSESTAAFVTAFSDFANQLTQCDEETIGRYRTAIQQVVDEEGHLLSTLVPTLATILGQQEKPVVETGHEAQASKRIKYVFRSFLRAISSPEHPLIILLDDLHWASEASLAVLASLVSDDANHGVLFLGTYRDDPSTDTRLLKNMLAQFDSTQVNVHSIRLRNLDEDAVHDMIADTLLLESDQTTSISKLIVSMTRGNVFFILALLRSLQDEELLRLDEDTMQWTCDSHMIRVTVEARTVDDLFKTKINDRPADVQETLKIASCLGSSIDPYLLQKIVTGNVSSHLNMAAVKGLLTFDNSSGAFVFAHDGIQRATYSLIPAEDRVSFHLMIGRTLWRMLDDSELETYLFAVLRQLMLGDRLVTDQEERTATASLCLRAGEKAVELSNFETASVYLRHGIWLLGPQQWRDSYVRSLQLHNAAAEVSYCTAQFDDVDKYVDAILLNARSFQDTLHARATHIYALGSRGRAQEAIENGLTTLKHLGERLPSNPSVAQLLISMWRTKRLLRDRSNAAILRLPAMTDAEKVAAMQILNLIYVSALYSRPLLAGVVAARMVRLTVTHGVCAVSSVGFCFYAMQLCR
jgi:predicted ATPase